MRGSGGMRVVEVWMWSHGYWWAFVKPAGRLGQQDG